MVGSRVISCGGTRCHRREKHSTVAGHGGGLPVRWVHVIRSLLCELISTTRNRAQGIGAWAADDDSLLAPGTKLSDARVSRHRAGIDNLLTISRQQGIHSSSLASSIASRHPCLSYQLGSVICILACLTSSRFRRFFALILIQYIDS